MIAWNQRRRALFGGALRCAGLAGAVALGSTAHAEFVPDDGYSFGSLGVLDTTPYNIASEFNLADPGQFFPTTTFTDAGGTVSSYANASVIGASITVTDPTHWGLASADARQAFMVSSAKPALIEWDFTNIAATNLAVLILGDVTKGGDLAYINSGAGSYLVDLAPNTRYYLVIGLQTGDLAVPGSIGSVYARITNVPTPSALALAAVSMLSTRRRRRQVD